MRFVTIAGAAVLALAPFTSVFAEDSDRVGDLLRTIKKARLIDLSSSWENDSPVAGVNPPYHFRLRDTHASSRGFFALFGERRTADPRGLQPAAGDVPDHWQPSGKGSQAARGETQEGRHSIHSDRLGAIL